MEILVASTVAVLTAGGVYLLLRLRTFPIILGLALLSYAVNVFLFASGRLAIDQSPILSKYGDASYSDPLPQALVLTAIVISFGMTAVLVMIGLGAYLESETDRIDIEDEDTREEGQP
ncbi:NADH-ubiquinone oxidoreductase chain 4L (plasmid) [Dinoroseobacter shibae DFL 12 = DSM 16493]|jgi:multicomponent K+:H+ antiporter subunit C|uniref:NADH-ubiquinone oxidoreductase chain 4L n=1 Tax=Dinoroseobacter shibae (strain DSM 16493 / NCIMB 14021 / DFL 12) TaxID=398580 RepID=A8LTG9_DINSH|nr:MULTISPECIES: Na+/H+ antiporter subunit C [Dinoroseobacter]ABV95536.1 NADH-ubiquinone oxidoreductase chain 4L [Dinoroseobacter shibae DFL 12 = DSM 16493]MDD9718792.1 Na+/H+ antiporter subunit C [Dinoroseobacter sp. PD6]URF48878.1 Na+/H+ antiporter subunit C [Dinoroseobacter shibae]URF53190.1 Na+/H+ antiporter subunit C [Dinoroseobacter shibae]